MLSLATSWSEPEHFFDFPYPSDLRLSPNGGPDLSGLPVPPTVVHLDSLLPVAEDRLGFPANPVGYFRFSGPITAPGASDVLPAEPTASVLLIDIDEESPERGTLLPTVATVLPPDGYVPSNLLAVGPRPGFVLAPNRTYAFVITTALLGENGQPVAGDGDFQILKEGGQPEGARGVEAQQRYQPLWPALAQADVPLDSVAAATVFSTADVVADTAALAERVRQAVTVTIDDLALDPDDGADHPRFCELHGTVTFPQYQRGDPPFSTEGVFEFDDTGMPIEQRQEVAPVVITLPKEPMPAGGYPLVLYFHGSGGLSGQVVDRGKVMEVDGEPTKGEGPAHVVAAHGFAAAGSAHPLNPERYPGASELEYINFDNLGAFRDTFRQGVIEQRLYIDALLDLEIPPDLLTGCDGPSLPGGEQSYRFAAEPLLAMGQSMGGMYTNLIGAVDPRIQAVVPTGAGGFWSFFMLETSLVGGKTLISILLKTDRELSYMHPALQVLQTAWEPADPLVYMPRLAHHPLEGHPVRSVYEPVGRDDSYFPMVLYDAIALAYGHPQAGDVIWPSMQEALALAGLDGLLSYPVENNLESQSGTPFTGVVVQYEGDGIYDPHAIYGQLDAVKHQYGCFFETFRDTGTAVVPAPAALGTPCAQ
ncbi:MAG: hypothetical protein DRI90_14465 [Deltaproteobacteria bacterium]|nr:MAG: hypothetical protein DRI90_14465 [Deltaproteobacteria bacterium]